MRKTLVEMDLENHDVSIVENPQMLSIPDLAEEYQKLSTCYIAQKQRIDQYMQQIHILKQDKALKDKLLDQELQEITENYDRELKDAKNKHTLECEDLQNRLTEARMLNEKIVLENDILKSEFEEKINQLQAKTELGGAKACNDDETIVSNKRIEYLTKVESEYADLAEEVNQIKLEKFQLMSRIAQIENELEYMKECYECSQENLKCKSNELEETQLIVDSLQEKLVGVENELMSYKNGDSDHNKKGNSLFAEVDDQRQHMRDLLRRQKEQYQTMKIKYERSSGEINRLKRENAEMLNEIKECVNMFKNADKFHKSKLNEHIGFLKTENNRLSEKLKQTQIEMDSLAKTQGVNWLSSMLEFCEHETKELNSKLMSYGMKKCEAEGLYAQAQERAAKWRFEALKSRCIIMNREMLLENNNISFDRKMQNIRHQVENQFGPNAEPIIDDVLSPADDSIHVSKTEDDPVQDDDVTESWSDVKEIFADINGHSSLAKSTQHGRPFKNLNITDNTIILLPNEEDSQHEKNLRFPTIDTSLITKYVNTETTASAPIENKENINNRSKEELNNSIATSPEKANETLSGAIDISEHNHSNDSQNRVRQVNVEMFTVTLKRRDSTKIEK